MAQATYREVATDALPDQAAENMNGITCPAPAPLLNPAAEARRQKVLAMLTDTEADPEVVLLTLAIRGRATCELRIPRDCYDPFMLLDLIERYGATVH